MKKITSQFQKAKEKKQKADSMVETAKLEAIGVTLQAAVENHQKNQMTLIEA